MKKACLRFLLALVPLMRAAGGTSEEAVSASSRDPLAGFEILRCHFSEKRLVVRREGKLTVVHEGEDFPGGGLHVEQISASQATLTEGRVFRGSGDKAVSIPQKMIVLRLQEDGSVSMQVFLDHDPDSSSARLMAKSEVSVWVPGHGGTGSGLTPGEAFTKTSTPVQPTPKAKAGLKKKAKGTPGAP